MRFPQARGQTRSRALDSRLGLPATLVQCCAVLGWFLLTACGDGRDDQPEAPYLTELASEADLSTLSSDEDELKVKYLAKVDGRAPFEPLSAPCYFQNMNLYSWHLQFLQSFPEHRALTFDAYHELVIRSATRKLWGGTVQAFPDAQHPGTGEKGVLTYVVYAETGGLTVDGVAEIDARLKSCMPFAHALLVFVPELPDQSAFLMLEREALRARGVSSLFPADLRDQ